MEYTEKGKELFGNHIRRSLDAAKVPVPRYNVIHGIMNGNRDSGIIAALSNGVQWQVTNCPEDFEEGTLDDYVQLLEYAKDNIAAVTYLAEMLEVYLGDEVCLVPSHQTLHAITHYGIGYYHTWAEENQAREWVKGTVSEYAHLLRTYTQPELVEYLIDSLKQ